MKKTFFTIFLSLVVAGAAVAAWGVVSFKGNAVVQERELFVGRDVTYEQLMDSLKPSLKHHLAFDLYAERLSLKDSYKVGHYLVKDGMNVIEVVRMLKLGLQTPINVTMNNVKIPAQLAGKLKGMGDTMAFEQVMLAVADFEKGNMRLSTILAAMK